MDAAGYNLKLWGIVKADEDPEGKLEDILYRLPFSDRISFLKFALYEYNQGNIDRMLEDRWNKEDIPDYFFRDKRLSYDLSPRDLFLQHLNAFSEQLNVLFKKTIPAKLRQLDKEVKDIQDRERALGKLNFEDECTDPSIEKLTVKETAILMKKEVRTILDYIQKGKLKPCSVGGVKKNYLIPITRIHRAIEQIETEKKENRKKKKD